MKFKSKLAIKCTICKKRIRGTGGTYTDEYRTMILWLHFSEKHPDGKKKLW